MTEARFSFTTKVNGDLLTVRGDTGGEFATNLTYLLDNADKLVEGLTALQAIGHAAVLVAPEPPAQQFPSSPQPAPAATGWGAAPAAPAPAAAPAAFAQAAVPQCQHGPRQPVAKSNWKAWFCPTEKGDPTKCDPIFVDSKKDPAGWAAFPA